MIFSGLFKKKITAAPDFSALGADMHSHLIPAIDDGSETFQDSLELISTLKKFGYKKLITTPHIMSEGYKNSPEIILPGLERLRKSLAENSIEMPIEAAAEYYYDYEFTQKIGKEKLLTFGDNYLLFEISFINPPDNLYETIFRLLTAGYKPILAHPERYPFFWNNFSEFEKLKSAGVFLQINMNSLVGYYSHQARRVAERIIDAGLVDFAGTDLHRKHHLGSLANCSSSKYYRKLISSGRLLNHTLLG